MSTLTHLQFGQRSRGSDREERQRRLIRAEMCDERGVMQDVVIRNVSKRGIGLAARQVAPVLNENVTLRLPGNADVGGTVKWVDRQNFGVELHEEMDLRALANAVSRNIQRSTQQSRWQVQPGHKVVVPTVDPSKLRKI